MLAPAVLCLLASLISSPSPCLASPSAEPASLNTVDFDHAAFWEQLKKDFTPPGEPLRAPYGPRPEPRHPHLRERDKAGAVGARPPYDLPVRSMQMSRLYRPWGDGFVRMPVQRQSMNDTTARRPRAGRIRRPNKSTYPSNNGNTGGLAPNVTTAVVTSTTQGLPIATGPAMDVAKGTGGTPAEPQKRSIPARDVAVGSPAAVVPAAAAQPAAEAADPKKPPGYQDHPGWAWSHLDDYLGTAYFISLDIGKPFQRVHVAIDTGSYELWVNPKCVGSPDPVLCGTLGHYYPQLSTTARNITDEKFKVVYGTGEAAGAYYMDWVTVSSWQVPAVQFAVADDTNYTYSGVLGLGYTYGFTTTYPTLLSMMWSLGFVAAPVFSIGLGGDGERFSELIFGGVNRWKFTGNLEPIEIWPPIDKQDPSWLQYWVNVTSIGMTFPGSERVSKVYTSTNFVMPMLIDSGSTLSYIREDVVAVIGKQLGAAVDPGGNYWVDCKLRSQNGTVDVGFNNGRMVITIPYKDFIWEQSRGRCLMGFQPADQGSTNYVLGDTFLRGAYLVFDQQVDVVWMADYYNCGDGVQMVGEHAADTQYVVGQC